MTYPLDDAQMAAVLSLGSEDRFWHFVAKVAQTGQMWGLHADDGWLMPLSPEGFEYLPLWPHRRFAQVIGDLTYNGAMAREIAFEDFRDSWLGELDQAGVRVGVFPDTDGVIWDIDAASLLDRLEEERDGQL